MKQVLVERQVRLTSLSKHPGWDEMREEFLRKEERLKKPLVSKLLAGEATIQRDIDWVRGFIAALNWAAHVPDGAEAALERAIVQATTIEGDQ